jgi:ribonuclease P protein component
MLRQINRLSKKKDFEKVFKEGKSSYDKLLGIKILPNNLDYSRFGILVGSKISKKAVLRNLIRRRIREFIKSKIEQIEPGYDLVVITLSPIKECQYDEIASSLFLNLRHLRVLKR